MDIQNRPCAECRYEEYGQNSTICKECKNGRSAFVPKHKSVLRGHLKYFDSNPRKQSRK